MTSSISSAGTLWRATISASTSAARSSGRMPERPPRKRPMGVRRTSIITAFMRQTLLDDATGVAEKARGRAAQRGHHAGAVELERAAGRDAVGVDDGV